MRRLLSVLVALFLALGGMAVGAAPAQATASWIGGTAQCQRDGTYQLRWTPMAGTTFDRSYTPVVYTKTGTATIFTPTTAYTPRVARTATTMVVPGAVAGSYRLSMAYVAANGLSNMLVADVTVDGTCRAR